MSARSRVREMRRVAGIVVPLLAVALAFGACRPDDQRTRSLNPRGDQTRAGLAPEVVEALDSGTVAFREHRFEEALAHYERAAELDPDQAPGWFGVFMARRALGDLEGAEAAMERVRELAPGATILHPDEEDTLETGGRSGAGGGAGP